LFLNSLLIWIITPCQLVVTDVSVEICAFIFSVCTVQQTVTMEVPNLSSVNTQSYPIKLEFQLNPPWEPQISHDHSLGICDWPWRFFIFSRDSRQWTRASSFTRFLDHTWRTTVGRIPMEEWSGRRRDLYLTTNNNHNRQRSMPRRDSNPPSQ